MLRRADTLKRRARQNSVLARQSWGLDTLLFLCDCMHIEPVSSRHGVTVQYSTVQYSSSCIDSSPARALQSSYPRIWNRIVLVLKKYYSGVHYISLLSYFRSPKNLPQLLNSAPPMDHRAFVQKWLSAYAEVNPESLTFSGSSVAITSAQSSHALTPGTSRKDKCSTAHFIVKLPWFRNNKLNTGLY